MQQAIIQQHNTTLASCHLAGLLQWAGFQLAGEFARIIHQCPGLGLAGGVEMNQEGFGHYRVFNSRATTVVLPALSRLMMVYAVFRALPICIVVVNIK